MHSSQAFFSELFETRQDALTPQASKTPRWLAACRRGGALAHRGAAPKALQRNSEQRAVAFWNGRTTRRDGGASTASTSNCSTARMTASSRARAARARTGGGGGRRRRLRRRSPSRRASRRRSREPPREGRPPARGGVRRRGRMARSRPSRQPVASTAACSRTATTRSPQWSMPWLYAGMLFASLLARGGPLRRPRARACMRRNFADLDGTASAPRRAVAAGRGPTTALSDWSVGQKSSPRRRPASACSPDSGGLSSRRV